MEDVLRNLGFGMGGDMEMDEEDAPAARRQVRCRQSRQIVCLKDSQARGKDI